MNQDSRGDETTEPGADHSLTEFRLVLGAGVFAPVSVPATDPTATPTPTSPASNRRPAIPSAHPRRQLSA